MRRARTSIGWLAGLIIASEAMAGAAGAQSVYVYPDRGQSSQQQERDKNECYGWAVQQSRFDPANPRVAMPPPPSYQTPQAGPVRGAAGGAALGAIGGAIAGSPGTGAAIGAATGALFGTMRRANQEQQQAQAQQNYQAQQQAAVAQGQAEFNRAYGACLAGRGYTVR